MPNTPFIVTQALPYANGPLHLGHILEATQVDIWVRFLRMSGQEVFFCCADDAHGAAISIAAKAAGITPEQWIETIHDNHTASLKAFNINYDNFYTTHSKENFAHSAFIYEKMKQKGVIVRAEVEQWYDPVEKLFLADRMVKGNCPRCQSEGQYGDNCEKCGATYNAIEIATPISTVSGTKPVRKRTEQLFVNLNSAQDIVWQWIQQADIAPTVKNKLKEWFEAGLQNWDISRNAPYFGIPIPDETDKFFYVWLDAPIGYIASLDNFCKRNNIDTKKLWSDQSDSQIYHFIGKDIVYFHCIFWPAMLHLSNIQLPKGIVVHGFLTINGEKMSKSKGTFIAADDFLNIANTEENLDNLRYLLASKLRNEPRDIDLNFSEMVQKVNVDLVGKVVNIASRCSKLLHNNHAGELSSDTNMLHTDAHLITLSEKISQHFSDRDTSLAIHEIMQITDEVNQFINTNEPWKLKQASELKLQQEICSSAFKTFIYIVRWLSPATIKLANDVQLWLYPETPTLTWPTADNPIQVPASIPPYVHLKARSSIADFSHLTSV